MYLNGGVNDYYSYSDITIPANEWMHIAFVFKNSEGLKKIYINGVDHTGYGPNKTSTPSGIPSTVTIGSLFTGYLSDYRIYATALSASDVQALYELGEV